MIVSDNNGTMNVRTQGNMFFLIINLPIPNSKTIKPKINKPTSSHELKNVLTDSL
jgi:hypothetical protein